MSTVEIPGAAPNPCTACGACCTRFRVSFYWGEADDAPGGTVPVALTEQVSPTMRAMRRDPVSQRCVALGGEPGSCVSCRIYTQRSSTCREFDAREPDGSVNPRCNAARAGIGLPPLVALTLA
ncbi:YkgJ family cysteine cluster protein [Uliginosibacterium sp. H1]|uniref:YkgJ family cysteine cluster protein n=1 Tax=Uliginosibacterium sp. H1 TaxID=3114757 RepID=UPI002E19F196|nr:YkgJ family cysteine cluster protein [Uliginosibacterium sp. H1]